MAVNLDVAEKNLEDLEKEITCAVCQEHYTDPKILPCLHCYCKQCILKLSLRVDKGKPFGCPECRKDTILPKGGEEELKSAFIINRLKSMYFKHKKALSKRVNCEICTNSEALAKAFCHQCDKFACENCVNMHSVMKAAFDGHECVPIEQLQRIRSEELVPKHPEPKKCRIHGEQLKIFCFDCNQLICRDCIVKDHRDHNIEFNNVAADNKKKALVEALKPLREIEESLSQALADADMAVIGNRAREMVAAMNIENSFEKLHQILVMRKRKLLEEIKVMTEKDDKDQDIQRKKLSIFSGEVRSVIDHAEQCVRLCSDDEVMSMHSDVTTRIAAQVREYSERETDQDISERSNIIVEVECAETLQQFCQENTWVLNTTIAESALNFEMNEVPETMIVNEDFKFTISNKSGKMISASNLEYLFRNISTGITSTAKITKSNSYKYDVTYLPAQRGRYELELKAYGLPVRDGSFTRSAYAKPTQLDVPKNVWNNISYPHSIAVNSREEIVLVENEKAINILTKAGNIIVSIDMKSLGVESLRSIAIDQEDYIYIIGSNSNKIAKCDSYINNVQIKEVQKFHRPGQWDLAIAGDELLVTERFNKGQITVFGKDLNFVRCISTSNEVAICHLCPDGRGNLYVTMYNNTIAVINMNGDTLRTFSQDQDGVQLLKNSWMVNVYSRFVCVADYNLQKTVVFTTEGKYITTFGHYGPTCVDKDGVVYNCNCIDNSVHIY